MNPVHVSGAFILLSSAAVFAIPPPRYFPLDLGNTWTYEVSEGFGGERTVEVRGIADGLTRVNLSGTEVLIADRQAELDIDLPDVGLVSYYRFNEPSFLHRDVFSCDDGRTLVAASKDDTVVTPAGTFTDCLRLEYEGGQCSDGGTLTEWWKLEEGRVKWIEDTIAGPRIYVLKSFERGSPQQFRRGDAEGGGIADLSDAVFVLNWLFSGGPTPACLDAADSNDDGKVDIADPIALLGHLFLGTEPPPPPGAAACGEDPTQDELSACAYDSCEDTLTD